MGISGCFLKWWYPQIIHFNRIIGCSIINHPFRCTPIFGNTHIWMSATWNSKSEICLIFLLFYGGPKEHPEIVISPPDIWSCWIFGATKSLPWGDFTLKLPFAMVENPMIYHPWTSMKSSKMLYIFLPFLLGERAFPRTGWWFQPIWKILVKLGMLKIGMKIQIFETTT